MAERRQPGVPEHQIERQRVERPDQDLDAEIGIEPDARDPQRHRGEQQPRASMAGVISRAVLGVAGDDVISGLEHALLAPQAAGAEGHDRDQQHVHRQQRPFRRIGAGQADGEADQQAATTAPQKLPTPPSTMTRNAGITASTPICGRMPQIGATMMPAIAASMVPSTNTQQPQPRQVDAERAHDLAVMRAGLDGGAERRLLDHQPDQADDRDRDAGRIEAIGRPDQIAERGSRRLIACGTCST